MLWSICFVIVLYIPVAVLIGDGVGVLVGVAATIYVCDDVAMGVEATKPVDDVVVGVEVTKVVEVSAMERLSVVGATLVEVGTGSAVVIYVPQHFAHVCYS